MTFTVFLNEEIAQGKEVENEGSDSDHSALDEEFHEIIMWIVGAMIRATETLGDFGKGIHAGSEGKASFLDGIAGDILPERLSPDQGAVRIGAEAFMNAFLKVCRENEEDEGKEDEWEEEEAIAEECHQEDEKKQRDPGYSGESENEHGGECAEND